jgi:hypothetical protein
LKIMPWEEEYYRVHEARAGLVEMGDFSFPCVGGS